MDGAQVAEQPGPWRAGFGLFWEMSDFGYSPLSFNQIRLLDVLVLRYARWPHANGGLAGERGLRAGV